MFGECAARGRSHIDPSCYILTGTGTDVVIIPSVRRSEHCAAPPQIFFFRWTRTTASEPPRSGNPPIRATRSINVQPYPTRTISKPTFCANSVPGNTSRAHHEIPEGLGLEARAKKIAQGTSGPWSLLYSIYRRKKNKKCCEHACVCKRVVKPFAAWFTFVVVLFYPA